MAGKSVARNVRGVYPTSSNPHLVLLGCEVISNPIPGVTVKRNYLAMLTTVSLISVAGCGQNTTGIDILENPPTSADELPADFDTSTLQPDSARFVTEHEGISYYLAKPAATGSASSVCIVAAQPEVIGCSGSPEVTTGFDDREVRSVRDGADVDELIKQGWVSIHENLLVRSS